MSTSFSSIQNTHGIRHPGLVFCLCSELMAKLASMTDSSTQTDDNLPTGLVHVPMHVSVCVRMCEVFLGLLVSALPVSDVAEQPSVSPPKYHDWEPQDPLMQKQLP